MNLNNNQIINYQNNSFIDKFLLDNPNISLNTFWDYLHKNISNWEKNVSENEKEEYFINNIFFLTSEQSELLFFKLNIIPSISLIKKLDNLWVHYFDRLIEFSEINFNEINKIRGLIKTINWLCGKFCNENEISNIQSRCLLIGRLCDFLEKK